MVAAALGRIIRLYPTDFNGEFVHDVEMDPSLGPPPNLGYYPAVITEVNYRKRDGVHLELRDADGTVEDLKWREIDWCRELLVLEPNEDKWAILPSKPGQTRPAGQRPSKKPKRAVDHDGNTL